MAPGYRLQRSRTVWVGEPHQSPADGFVLLAYNAQDDAWATWRSHDEAGKEAYWGHYFTDGPSEKREQDALNDFGTRR